MLQHILVLNKCYVHKKSFKKNHGAQFPQKNIKLLNFC